MPLDKIIGNSANPQQLGEAMLKTMEQNASIGTDSAKAIKVLAEILASSGLVVTQGAGKSNNNEKGTVVLNGGPTLTTTSNQKPTTESLEKIIAQLQLENTDLQIKLSKNRINDLQGEISSRHKEQAGKIQESIDKARESERKKRRRRIFGWLFAAVAVVFAVAASVITGGAAVPAIVGATLAVGMAFATQFDAMEKLQKAIMDGLVKAGMSRKDAMLVAATIMLVLTIALAVTTAALTGGTDLGENAQNLVKAFKVIGIALDAISAGQGISSTITNKQAADAQIDTTLLNKILQQLQARLDEENEELQKLLDIMQTTFAGLAAVIEKDNDAMTEITMKLGAMGV